MKFDSSTLLPNLRTFMTKFQFASDSLFPTLSDVLKHGIFKSTQTSHASAIGRSDMHPMQSLKFLFLITGDIFYTENDTLQGFTALIV